MAGICYQFAESGKCRFGNGCKYSHIFTNSSMNKKRKNGTRNKKEKTRTIHPSADHLDTFFAQYPAFSYRQDSSSTQEFYRMCDFFGWDRDDPEREEAHDGFKTALVQQFNSLYGTEVDDIESWRGLSLALNIFPLPDDLNKAKKMFKGKFVNLVDLVDTGNTGKCAAQFNTLNELKEYTITTGKFFPKESAYAGGMLKFLLREIINSHVGGTSRRKHR